MHNYSNHQEHPAVDNRPQHLSLNHYQTIIKPLSRYDGCYGLHVVTFTMKAGDTIYEVKAKVNWYNTWWWQYMNTYVFLQSLTDMTCWTEFKLMWFATSGRRDHAWCGIKQQSGWNRGYPNITDMCVEGIYLFKMFHLPHTQWWAGLGCNVYVILTSCLSFQTVRWWLNCHNLVSLFYITLSKLAWV